MTRTSRLILALLAVLSVVIVPAGLSSAPQALATPAAGAPTTPGPVICGQPVLNSPWYYTGGATTFTSGQYPGLPTYGSAATNFPAATSGVIVPAGNNTTAADTGAYNLNNTVVFFEAGEHQVEGGMYAGNHSYYVGGYTSGAGEATLDGVDGATNGTGTGGARLETATPSAGNTVDDTWEYLTVKNYTSSLNNSVMGNVNGGGTDDGDTYKYDTIGPNEYGSSGGAPNTGQNSGGGYAIDAGNNTTIEYDCLTQDAQGGFNSASTINLHVSNNEISLDGIGSYPDTGTSPGQSTHSCGCSGGGKFFYTLNATISNNYVHDNYNVGVWGDFNNDGLDFSHNYVASNWSSGFMYESSYNASVSDNTFTGNGWASDGAWPAGTSGGACYGGVSCTNGNGPVTGDGGGNPFGVIDLSNSGGNASLATVSVPSSIAVPGCSSSCTLPSRYSGHLMVSGNALSNNFGGVKVYTDSNRYPGNIDNDSACSIPMGTLYQPNASLYYQQSKVLVTGSDAAVSGSAVTTSGGTSTICTDYGTTGSANDSPASVVTAPSVGMAVYNAGTAAYLGNVSAVTSAHSFTLTGSPGAVTGAQLVLSAYGGCGPADYFGASAPGASSGTPSGPYWDNCIWGSRNVDVTNNKFAMSASAVTGCTTGANLCGYQYSATFNAGVPSLMGYWDSMQSYVTLASGGLGNVFSGNAYTWSGSGAWTFTQGDAGNGNGNTMTWSQWQGAPNGQDAGSTSS
ncbi:MAG: right handed beta helix region family protein [Actinomycetia bacterium]|nr:right handed beta helix region family protein [Actinomycetes bacterium]